MGKSVFAPPGGQVRAASPQAARKKAKPRCQTNHVTVSVDPALGEAGNALADAVGARIEQAFNMVAEWFGQDYGIQAQCCLTKFSEASDGTGGAEHATCGDPALYCDADFEHPERTLALFVAELSEVFQANQDEGWYCGDTNGESLSRLHAELYAPGALDDYASFPVWLDSDRPDWIHNQQGTDTDYPSLGCGTGFLFWLVSQGHSPESITQAGGGTLAEMFVNLGGEGDPYEQFLDSCESQWPAGQPSGVASDNPWQGQPPPPPPPPPPGGGAAVLTVTEALPPGEYAIQPAGGSPPAMMAGPQAKPAGGESKGNLVSPELLEVLEGLLNTISSGTTAYSQQRYREVAEKVATLKKRASGK